MPHNSDYEVPGLPFSEHGRDAPPANELATSFIDTLKALARFGLASHTRLLLETSRQDG